MSGQNDGSPRSGRRDAGDRKTGRVNDRPPRLARALLRRVIPRAQRADAIADLEERFRDYAVPAMGGRRARRWYWRQALGSLHPRVWSAGRFCREERPGIGARSAGRRGSRTTAAGLRRDDATGRIRHPDSRQRSLIMGWGNDVRFGLRMMARSPGTTAVIVLTLAVGIGLNGAVFSLFNTIVLKPLPVPAPDRVVFLDSARPERGEEELRVSLPDFRDWRGESRSFAALAAWTGGSVNVSDGAGLPERLLGARVTPEMFDVLGAEPALGRRLGPADARQGAESVALVGFGIWQRRYAGDPSIVGRVVRVDGVPTTIVGVLPRRLERTPFNPELWRPLVADPADEQRDRRFLDVAGRLAEGVTLAEARAELGAIAARLSAAYPASNEDVEAVVRPFDAVFRDTANVTISWILLGAVGFLLLIACANVANLILSRAAVRAREMAVRTALGGSRWRIVRQLLIESLLLSLAAGALGAVLAVWGARALAAGVMLAAPPPWWDFSIDWRVFGFLAALALATSLASGLVPALRGTRVEVGETLKDGARGAVGAGSARLSGLLVVVQIGLAVVLLVGAALMTRSAVNATRFDTGIEAEGVLTMSLRLPESGYPSPDSRIAFFSELEGRLAALPGVESVALASSLPLQGGYRVTVELEDLPAAAGHPTLAAAELIVSPSYFRLAGVQVLRGRTFDEADGSTEPVAIVDARFAARSWPGEDPVGKRLRWVNETETRWVTVVGVVPEIRAFLPMPFLPDWPVVYSPYRQEALLGTRLLVRGAAGLQSGVDLPLTTALREEVRRLDADLPLYDIAPLEQVMGQATMGWKIVSILMGTLGGVALFLSCLGVYSVMAASVGRRRQEIGVRMALGARGPQVVGLVARSGLLQTTLGLGLGVAAALAVTRVLSLFLFDVSPTDPATFLLVAATLGATALAACIVPARRASRVDPLIALRSE